MFRWGNILGRGAEGSDGLFLGHRGLTGVVPTGDLKQVSQDAFHSGWVHQTIMAD